MNFEHFSHTVGSNQNRDEAPLCSHVRGQRNLSTVCGLIRDLRPEEDCSKVVSWVASSELRESDEELLFCVQSGNMRRITLEVNNGSEEMISSEL